MNRVSKLLIVLIAAFAGLPTALAGAAGTVRVEGDVLIVEGTPGADRNLITDGGPSSDGSRNEYDVTGDGLLNPGAGCEANGSTNRVLCTRPNGSPLRTYRMEGGAGDDTLEGPGGDSIGGVISGGPGRDAISGGGGVDQLDGGEGDDALLGDEGGPFAGPSAPKAADDARGGPGIDEFSYYGHRVSAVTASLDDVANDGGPGEGDNLHSDVEKLEGDSRSDFSGSNTLTGSDGPNELIGSPLADVLTGGGGNDRLIAYAGNDRLDGGAGDDFLEAGFDDDVLEGGPGLDSFVGDATQSDTIGTGNDVISARDGVAEPVSCGPGADRATVDAGDIVAADPLNGCETVDRAAGAPSGGGGGGGNRAAAFPLSATGSILKASAAGRVSVRLACRVPEATGCNGTVRLASVAKVRIGTTRRTFSLGSKGFAIAPARSARVTFTLSRANRRALRRLRKVKLRLTATERAATPRVVTKTVTLRR